jgi:GAF domain-containing protein
MLEQMSRRLHVQPSFEAGVGVILDDAIALLGAEFGTFQLPVRGHLVLADQRGFKTPFLAAFRVVRPEDGSACGRALRTRQTVLVADTEADEEFEPYRDVAKAAGYRSVATTPLVTRDDVFMGVVSTHFVNVHVPTPIEIETLQGYGTIAAEFLRRSLDGERLDVKAASLSGDLYERATAGPLATLPPAPTYRVSP